MFGPIKAAAGGLNLLRLDVLVGRRHKGRGSIILLHSVVADRHSVLNDEAYISCDSLDKLLGRYVSAGIDVVSLDDAVSRLRGNDKREFVCFTFDDGYRDNLLHALPLFERYKKPFTVYVTTAFVNRGLNVWWACLRELIKRKDKIAVPGMKRGLPALTLNEKISTYQRLCKSVSSGLVAQDVLLDLFRAEGLSNEQVLEHEALSEAELKKLAQSPLVEIGGHTRTHPRLTDLDDEHVRTEMLDNKIYLERAIGREVKHFAYPYGDRESCGPREFAIAREVGFKTATTTRIGGLFPQHLDHLTALPRLLGVNDPRVMECQRNGAAAATLTWFGGPVVTV